MAAQPARLLLTSLAARLISPVLAAIPEHLNAGRALANTAVITATAAAGSLLLTSCLMFLVCWLCTKFVIGKEAASPLAIYNGSHPVIITMAKSHNKKMPSGEGKALHVEASHMSADPQNMFSKPSDALTAALIQGSKQGHLTGQAFLAVQQNPGVYLANSVGRADIKLMLHELQPNMVAVVAFSHFKPKPCVGSSLVLKDGSKVQVLESLHQMIMVKAASHCVYLKQENALVMWNSDLSLLPMLLSMVHTCLARQPKPGFGTVAADAALAVQAQYAYTTSAVADEPSEHADLKVHRRQWKLLGTAACLLAAACACFIVMGIAVASRSLPAASDGRTKSLNISALVWSDEFEDRYGTSTGVDPRNWLFQTGDGSAFGLVGWGNNELEYYTDAVRNVNVTTLDGTGVLQITARQESASSAQLYTSAKLISRGLQSFTPKNSTKGIRIAVRALMPEGGAGIWPAIWMLPVSNVYGAWPASGEIDIVELTSSLKIQSTVWYGPSYPSTIHEYGQINATASVFHTYALDWTLKGLSFSVDGTTYYSIEPRTNVTPGYYATLNTTNMANSAGGAPFDQPFYILMNLAVGGTFPGNPTSSTVFPQSLYIDYVRMYDLSQE